ADQSQRTRRDSKASANAAAATTDRPQDRLVACETAPISSGPTRKPSEPSVITAASATPPSRAPAAYTQGDTVATPTPNSPSATRAGTTPPISSAAARLAPASSEPANSSLR